MNKNKPVGKVEVVEIDPRQYSVAVKVNPEFAKTLGAIQNAFDLQAELVRAELERAARQMGIESIPEHDRDEEQQAWLAARYLELDRRRQAANRYETLREHRLRTMAQTIIDRSDTEAVYDLLRELEDYE